MTPLPEITRTTEVIIMAANTAAPIAMVNAYHGEISIFRATCTRITIIYAHKSNDSASLVKASQPPLLKYQSSPNTGHSGKTSATNKARNAPNTPSHINEGGLSTQDRYSSSS